MSRSGAARAPIALSAVLALAALAPAEAEDAWEESLRIGLERLAADDPKAAIKPLKKAIKQRGAPCGACQLALARACYLTGAFAPARKAADEAAAQAEDQEAKLHALNLLGLAELEGGAAGPPGLARAEAAFRQVLAVADSNTVRYNLGEVLLRQAEDEEGVALLRAYVAAEPDGRHAERARLLIEKPRRARMDLVPGFEVVTLDGERLSSADLEGKVVLIDFWATWCGPCVAAIPSLKRLAARMQDEPLVVLSVSADRSEEAVRAFLDEHGITWPQVWDGSRQLTGRVFAVRGFPTYVLVDPEGEVLYRVTGGGGAVDADIARRVAKAVERAQEEPAG